MKIRNLTKIIGLSIVTSALLVGCGSSSDGSSSDGSPSDPSSPITSTSLTIVDPYIQDAVMYWDKNDNNIYDDGEQTSTATSKYGGCSFSPSLPIGAKVGMKEKGIHNGVAFDGSLTANISGTGIVSPITTLLEKFDGDTVAVIELLTASGITLTEEDLTKDPMSGLDIASSSLDDDIKRIQSSIAINTFLSVIGTDSDKDAIEAASDKLTESVSFAKNAITSTNITRSSVESAINSAVAVANYITAKAKIGEVSVLTDLSKTDTTNLDNLDNLMNALIAQYDANPEMNFGLDSTKDIAEASTSITEAKGMTAQQYFDFVGNSFEIEYSAGFDYESNSDANGSDDLDPGYMSYESSTKDTNSITYKWIDFNWDWDDEDNDGNTNEHNQDWAVFSGTVSGDTTTGTVERREKDGTQSEGTATLTIKTDGNVKIEYGQETGTSEAGVWADKTIFISANKVTEVAGVTVGDNTRDVYKVKSKEQYGQMDGTDFVTTGDGYNMSNDCGHVDMTVASAVGMRVSGGANNKLKFAADGKFVNKDTDGIVQDVTWKIIDDTLQVRAYDDYDMKIIDGTCRENWIGDLGYSFIGITPTEANSILKALVPNETLIIDPINSL